MKLCLKKLFKKKTQTKVISFLLVLCMSISLFPGTVLATTEETPTVDETVTPTETEEVSAAEEVLEPIILEEDVSKRGENEKHFVCDDGSYIAITYPEAVHEQIDGEWVDIEYDVTDDGSDISPVDEDIKVKFANNTNSAKLVKLETGDYKISWTVEAENEEGDSTEKVKLSKESKVALKTTKEITKENKDRIKNNSKHTYAEVFSYKQMAETEIENLEKAKKATNLEKNEKVINANSAIEEYNRTKIQSVSYAQSNVEYVGAFGEGTTLRYLLSPGKLNEEVVLDSYNGFKSYSMVMNTDGLTPVKTEFGRVNLTDENGNVMMTIAPPYMYDSANALSENITVTVTQESKKEWRITYTPDKEWLADSTRVYPVVIDPTVTSTNLSNPNHYDTYVYYGQGTEKYSDSITLKIGHISGAEYIAYWASNLPSIPSNCTISGASFNIKLSDQTRTMPTIGIYEITSAWTENITWTTRPSNSSTALDVEGSKPSNFWLRFSNSRLSNLIFDTLEYGESTIQLAIAYDAYEEDYNVLYSSESVYKPYIEIRYTIYYSAPVSSLYYIKNVATGSFLSVSGAATNTGTPIVQNSFSNSYSQVWELIRNEANAYTFVPMNAVDMKMVWGTAQTPMLNYYQNSSWGQWKFEQCSDGSYYISSLAEPWMVLDGLLNGNSVYIFPFDGNDNQKWILEPVMEISNWGQYTSNISYGEKDFLMIRPTISAKYTFMSTGNTNTYAELFLPGYLTPTVYDDNSGDGNNFQFSIELEADSVYYLHVSGANYSYGDYTLCVTRHAHPDAQNLTNWCWVATSKLVGEHNGGSGALPTGDIVISDKNIVNLNFHGITYTGDYTIDRGQYYIATSVLGSFLNQGGTLDDLERGLQIASANINLETTRIYCENFSSQNLSYILNELDNNRWLAAKCQSSVSDNHHALVIKGYSRDKNDSSRILFSVYDPNNNEHDPLITYSPNEGLIITKYRNLDCIVALN